MNLNSPSNQVCSSAADEHVTLQPIRGLIAAHSGRDPLMPVIGYGCGAALSRYLFHGIPIDTLNGPLVFGNNYLLFKGIFQRDHSTSDLYCTIRQWINGPSWLNKDSLFRHQKKIPRSRIFLVIKWWETCRFTPVTILNNPQSRCSRVPLNVSALASPPPPPPWINVLCHMYRGISNSTITQLRHF